MVGRGVRNKAKYVRVTRRRSRRGKRGIPSYNLIRRGRLLGPAGTVQRTADARVCVFVCERKEGKEEKRTPNREEDVKQKRR